jgi:predicted membrane protein
MNDCSLPYLRRGSRRSFFVAVLVLAVGTMPQAAFCANKITSFDPPGSTMTRVMGINLSGTIAGYYKDSVGLFHGFMRDSAGNVTPFDAPGAVYGTYIWCINDSGETAGYFADSLGHIRGFLRSASGTVSEFDAASGALTYPRSINNSGEVTGYYFPGYGDIGFILGTSGEITIFSPTYSISVEWMKINLGGQIAGFYEGPSNYRQGYFRDASGSIWIFSAPGASTAAHAGTFAEDMNDNGDIAGFFIDTSDAIHGFVRDAMGNFTQFDVPGATVLDAVAINVGGTIAGVYFDSATVYHGFVRDRVGNITTFDDPQAGTAQDEGTVVTCMNRYGGIAGYYIGPDSQQHGFFRAGH